MHTRRCQRNQSPPRAHLQPHLQPPPPAALVTPSPPTTSLTMEQRTALVYRLDSLDDDDIDDNQQDRQTLSHIVVDLTSDDDGSHGAAGRSEPSSIQAPGLLFTLD